MPEPNEQPDDQISKKVVYEHVTTSGTNREFIIVVVRQIAGQVQT